LFWIYVQNARLHTNWRIYVQSQDQVKNKDAHKPKGLMEFNGTFGCGLWAPILFNLIPIKFYLR
jgi:hypothetical protein